MLRSQLGVEKVWIFGGGKEFIRIMCKNMMIMMRGKGWEMGFAPSDWVKNVMGISTMKCDYTSKAPSHRISGKSCWINPRCELPQVEQVAIYIYIYYIYIFLSF